MNTNIALITNELHKAFKIINNDFFNNELPLPAITIQSSGKRLSMGWCTTKQVWRDKGGHINLYEINLSAEYINVSYLETMDTLMHEMVHLYNLINNVKDTSRNNTYHNKNFLNRALKSGFMYPHDKPDPKYGYSNIRLTDQTKSLLNEYPINKDVFSIARKKPFEMLAISNSGSSTGEVEKKPTSYRWLCPSCNLIVRSSKANVNLVCGDCRTTLVNVEKEEE